MPFENASRTVFVVVGVRSSCETDMSNLAPSIEPQQNPSGAYVEIVVHDHHGRVTASALAFDFDHGELAVLCRFAGLKSA
jgi:hypothetical protein